MTGLESQVVLSEFMPRIASATSDRNNVDQMISPDDGSMSARAEASGESIIGRDSQNAVEQEGGHVGFPDTLGDDRKVCLVAVVGASVP